MATSQADLNELLQGSMSQEGVITTVAIKKAKEVFKDQARDPEREVAQITCDNGATEAHAVPGGMVYDEAAKNWTIVDKMQAGKSVRNMQSWFRKFLQKYMTLPSVGVKVKTMVNGRGFTVIEV